jgi:hypothetical protein
MRMKILSFLVLSLFEAALLWILASTAIFMWAQPDYAGLPNSCPRSGTRRC